MLHQRLVAQYAHTWGVQLEGACAGSCLGRRHLVVLSPAVLPCAARPVCFRCVRLGPPGGSEGLFSAAVTSLGVLPLLLWLWLAVGCGAAHTCLLAYLLVQLRRELARVRSCLVVGVSTCFVVCACFGCLCLTCCCAGGSSYPSIPPVFAGAALRCLKQHTQRLPLSQCWCLLRFAALLVLCGCMGWLPSRSREKCYHVCACGSPLCQQTEVHTPPACARQIWCVGSLRVCSSGALCLCAVGAWLSHAGRVAGWVGWSHLGCSC